VRFDTQKLPAGVFVVGFLARSDEGDIKEIFSPRGGLTAAQKQNLATATEYARAVLEGRPWDDLQVALDSQLEA